MTGDEAANMPPYAPVPPTQPGEMYLPQQPSAWPKVIGIIAIVLGALGVLGGCMGLASTLFVDTFKGVLEDMMPSGQPSPLEPLEAVYEHKGWMIVTQFLTMGAAVLLLFVGIGLLKRAAWSARAAMYWAVIKMAVVVPGAVLAYMANKAQLATMAEQGGGFVGSGLVEAIGAASIGLSVVWGWALPVFVLIWFSRAKIKAEVAGWS